VHAFKAPSAEELAHDFLWRTGKDVPARGRIGIFNRSHYEEVLTVRVHPELLAKQRIPTILAGKNIWRERFEDIAAFERYLTRQGTVMLKFFLNVSKQEQRQRFLSRLDDPAKNWKFAMQDVTERALWGKYQAAYQEMVRHTSSAVAPWYVVPADHKWFARVVIGSTVVRALDALNWRFPRVDKASLEVFDEVRKALENEGKGGARKVAQIAKAATKGS
jgi:PPK2 family polyphosphate:nucleotide phosphotransferase